MIAPTIELTSETNLTCQELHAIREKEEKTFFISYKNLLAVRLSQNYLKYYYMYNLLLII